MKNDVFRYAECPMHRTMAIMGSRWKPVIIYALRSRKARFGQLHASIGTISKKVLTSSLKELEADGILTREEFKELPPRVEYNLTDKGRSLVPIIVDLAKWDNKHYEQKIAEKEEIESVG
ncbi:helix-turn-helix domain-containing protein [Flavobacterium sp. DG1-102-2]|uniref:winged helix-turn-helix transcriptional regulator n=1 Tax=Flavobacterium sp. DG1-102-2 TaxID=3081663 RepID=UPI00294A6F06|nr:helix-turn-helix domain-containing protein [Flavobacterium sp. DG1-102-2]MDV6169376.1 helix-turn-helix domain-containing protein [Flavobacterium sp. DG1-102-2]